MSTLRQRGGALSGLAYTVHAIPLQVQHRPSTLKQISSRPEEREVYSTPYYLPTTEWHILLPLTYSCFQHLITLRVAPSVFKYQYILPQNSTLESDTINRICSSDWNNDNGKGSCETYVSNADKWLFNPDRVTGAWCLLGR